MNCKNKADGKNYSLRFYFIAKNSRWWISSREGSSQSNVVLTYTHFYWSNEPSSQTFFFFFYYFLTLSFLFVCTLKHCVSHELTYLMATQESKRVLAIKINPASKFSSHWLWILPLATIIMLKTSRSLWLYIFFFFHIVLVILYIFFCFIKLYFLIQTLVSFNLYTATLICRNRAVSRDIIAVIHFLIQCVYICE